MRNQFRAEIKIIGVNPYVSLPEKVLQQVFKEAGKDKGHIPVCGKVNKQPYKQTLVKFRGEWRLYINTVMLKNSPKRIGEVIEVTVKFDPESREISIPEGFVKALAGDKEAKKTFDSLPPSRRKEIVRYLANLKSEEALKRNIGRAIHFLAGKGRFVGREKP